MSKSKKQFLENYSSNPELHKKVLKQGLVEWQQLIKYPQDYYAAESGSVPGFIYYKDTVKFANRHHLKILQILDEFECDCGKLENKPSPTDEVQYFNFLAFFAWEALMRELIVFIED